MFLKLITRKFSQSSQAYTFSDIGQTTFEGIYSGKADYLDFLKQLPEITDKNKIKTISDNFKTLFDGKTEISNLGIGSYLGNPTVEDDFRLKNSLLKCLKSGINTIDTAANYRYYKSERTIGKVLSELIQKDHFQRKNAFICSKIGYVTEDPDRNLTNNQIIQEVIEKSKKNSSINNISVEDFIGEAHSIHPDYISYQLENTLKNLNIKTLDVLYLHNVFEMQLALKGKKKTLESLKKAFEFCEKAIVEKKIASYGLATWNTFRSKIEEVGIHVSLEEIVQLAVEIGGKDHGFRFIQAPMNFVMHEIYSMKWQFSKKNQNYVSTLDLAEELGINVITSASLMQKYVLNLQLPFEKLVLKSNAQAHLQLMRSMPFSSIKSSLVGMMSDDNVQENVSLMGISKLSKEDFDKFIVSLKPGK